MRTIERTGWFKRDYKRETKGPHRTTLKSDFMLVIYLMIAWRILHFVTWGRECPDRPCDVVFDPEEWQAAWIVAHRRPPPDTPPKLSDMVRLIAGFGGFLGRKHVRSYLK